MQSQYRTAESYLNRALETSKSSNLSEELSWQIKNNLALACLFQNKLEEAEKLASHVKDAIQFTKASHRIFYRGFR